MKAYIISFLNSNAERRRIHREQLDYLVEHGVEPVVLNMVYEPEDYDSRVQYVGDNRRMDQVHARNILLDQFYSTDERYALFMDNDSVPEREGKWHDEMWRQIDSLMLDWDFISPQYIHVTHFFSSKAYNQKCDLDRLVVEENYPKFSCVFLKNFRYFYGDRPKFDTRYTFKGRVICHEDVDFSYCLSKRGYRVGTLMNIAMNEQEATNQSTWFEKRQELEAASTLGRLLFAEKHGVPLELKYQKMFEFVGFTRRRLKKNVYEQMNTIRLAQNREQMKKFARDDQDAEFIELPHPMPQKEAVQYFREVMKDDPRFEEARSRKLPKAGRTRVIVPLGPNNIR